jgi:hypothetical protein
MCENGMNSGGDSMKKTLVLAILVMVPVGVPGPMGQVQGQEGLSKLMASKLKNSQRLLEGLALADFDKISRSAEELIQLSKTAEWMVLKTPRYELHSNEFRRAAETVLRKARAKNLDGAALAYFDMTMTCLRCHQYVREQRDARLPLIEPAGLARNQ